MKHFLLFILLLPVMAFHKQDEKTTIKTVKMKFVDETQKVVFDGYKDASIVLSSFIAKPVSGRLEIKISGYFKSEYADVRQYKYEIDESHETFTYIAKADAGFISVILSYNLDDTPRYAIVTVQKIVGNKTKYQIFTLTGFE